MKEGFKKWFLLSGNRHNVVIVLLIIISGIVVIPAINRPAIHNTNQLPYIFSSLTGGNITLITVVVAINQVVLSQEMESPGAIRNQIDQTVDYRKQALDKSAPPTELADFLQQLLRKTQEDAQSLEGSLRSAPDEINNRLLEELPEQCEQSRSQVGASSNKLSSVIVPLLGIDFSIYINYCYQLQSNHAIGEDEQFETKLDTLISDLEDLVITRQYFATALIKKELATLSRLLLYVGVLAVSLPITFLYYLTTYTGTAPPRLMLSVFTLITIIVGLIPLALLISHLLRIATISQYVAIITPFSSQR